MAGPDTHDHHHHHEHEAAPAPIALDTPQARQAVIKQILADCREQGLRRTKALELLLEEMLERGQPLTLGDLAASERLRTQCDQATVYRLLTRLERVGVLRRLGLHQRSAYYTLLLPGQHRDYLVCTTCGQIESVSVPCILEEMEAQVMRKSGYASLYHELEFFGICPSCKPA
jgi:Fe2+ or Zn2+ uptake regulation protein